MYNSPHIYQYPEPRTLLRRIEEVAANNGGDPPTESAIFAGFRFPQPDTGAEGYQAFLGMLVEDGLLEEGVHNGERAWTVTPAGRARFAPEDLNLTVLDVGADDAEGHLTVTDLRGDLARLGWEGTTTSMRPTDQTEAWTHRVELTDTDRAGQVAEIKVTGQHVEGLSGFGEQ